MAFCGCFDHTFFFAVNDDIEVFELSVCHIKKKKLAVFEMIDFDAFGIL